MICSPKRRGEQAKKKLDLFAATQRNVEKNFFVLIINRWTLFHFFQVAKMKERLF